MFVKTRRKKNDQSISISYNFHGEVNEILTHGVIIDGIWNSRSISPMFASLSLVMLQNKVLLKATSDNQ